MCWPKIAEKKTPPVTGSVAVRIIQRKPTNTVASIVLGAHSFTHLLHQTGSEGHPPANICKSWLIRDEKAGLVLESWRASFSFYWPLASDLPAAASYRNTDADVPDGHSHEQTYVQTSANPHVLWRGSWIRNDRGLLQALGVKEEVQYNREGQNAPWLKKYSVPEAGGWVHEHWLPYSLQFATRTPW